VGWWERGGGSGGKLTQNKTKKVLFLFWFSLCLLGGGWGLFWGGGYLFVGGCGGLGGCGEGVGGSMELGGGGWLW